MPAEPARGPFSASRRMVAASVAVSGERNTIHLLTEVDITEPRRLLRAHREATGEALSFTGLVVACLARAVAEQPELNAFRTGRRLVRFRDVAVNTLVERQVGGERVPDAYPIHAAQSKTLREIHNEIRAAQRHQSDRLGSLSAAPRILNLIPEWLARVVIRRMARSPRVARHYGVVAVTAIGMFGEGALWAVPVSSATVALAVGGIVRRPALRNGTLEEREHLCLTATFDHEIVDGAPAARLLARLGALLSSGDLVRETTETQGDRSP